MKHITVTISPNGKVTVHVQGVAGATCTNLTAALESALGGKAETHLTNEFFSGGDDETAGVQVVQ